MKRIISMLMCLVMVMCMFNSITVIAAENGITVYENDCSSSADFSCRRASEYHEKGYLQYRITSTDSSKYTKFASMKADKYISFKKGGTYEFSFKAKAGSLPDGKSTLSMQAQLNFSSEPFVDSEERRLEYPGRDFSLTTDWQDYTFEFTISEFESGAEEYLNGLYFSVITDEISGNNIRVFLDDIKIVQSGIEVEGELPLVGTVTRTISNYDFDSQDDADAFVLRNASLGIDSGVGELTLTSKTYSETNSSSVRMFNIPDAAVVRNGGTYTISFKAKASVDQTKIYMGIYNDKNVFLRPDGRVAAGGGGSHVLTTEWQEYSYTLIVDKFVVSKEITTPSDTTECYMYIYSDVYNSEKGDLIWIDDLVVTETIDKSAVLAYPVVESVEVTGVAQVGHKLTANAVVTDENEEDTPFAAYQWQYLDGDAWKDISGKTEKEYIVDEAYIGKQLRVAVTPRSDNEPLKGTVVYSEATEAVGAYTYPPSGTGLTVSGSYTLGEKLTATFEYVPSESNIPKGDSIFVWETSAAENGEYAVVQTSVSDEYTLKINDVGMWIRVRVIPKDTNGLAGPEIVSEAALVTGSSEIFVSASGDDNNAGTIDSPFKTIEKARDAVRSLKNKPEGGIVVNIRGGVYPVSETIEFTAEDSGSKDCPVIYKAYNGEKVSFIGGKTLDTSKIQKVTESELLDRLNVPEARDHLYMLDLGAQGIEMSDLESYGWGYTEYRPMRIYMNNSVLTEARWPNDSDSEMYVKARPLTNADDGIDEDKFNTTGTPLMYEYPDPENRSANWTVNKGDAYVGGAVTQMWCSQNLLIDTIDVEKKVVTSLNALKTSAVKGVGYGPVYAIYFSNIPEEIDKPGESYVDRLGEFGKKDVLYFYPVGDLNGEMVVSTLKDNMISVTDAEYITFSGIDFKDTIETPVLLTGCDNIRIENAEIANSSRGAVAMMKTKNSVISGCNIYSTGEVAIAVECDSAGQAELIPTGNIIENNNFHSIVLLPSSRNKRTAICLVYSVGDVIRNNEFNDLPFGALDLSYSQDVVFEYNRVLNAEQINSDGGAVYWGRMFYTLGNVVRYNYFENTGSKYITNRFKLDGVGSFFVDDIGTSANIYGNIMYNGGTGQAPMFANGAEFGNMHGNISITDDPDRLRGALNHRAWANTVSLTNLYGFNKTNYPDVSFSSWLYIMGLRTPYGASVANFNAEYSNYFTTDAWKNHYAGTQWEGAINIYNKNFYDGAKELYDAQDYKGVLEYLAANIPNKLTNNIHNNAVFGVTTMNTRANHFDNYIGTEGRITDAEKAMFVDYDNKDFTLKPEGLAKIQEKAPEFEAILFNKIGLLDKTVGGHKPVAKINSDVISGVAAPGGTVSVSYTYSDADGDLEGNSKVYWYVGDKANGNFEKIHDVEGKSFKVPEEFAGRFIKYEVVPYDTTVLRGESVMSAAFQVKSDASVDFSALAEVIAEATKLADSAVVGTETGTFPAESVEALRTAISEAQKVANATEVYQYQVNDAVKALEAAINVFKISENMELGFVNVEKLLESAEGWVDKNGEPIGAQYDAEAKTLTLTDSEIARYTGEKFGNEIFNFKLRFEPVSPAEKLPAINAADTDLTYSINGGGFKVRGQIENGEVWYSSDYGLLTWLKNTTYELQEYSPAATVTSFDNDVFTEFGKDYDVSYGAYDAGGKTRVVLYVDGVLVSDIECTDDGNLGLKGYLTFRGCSNSGSEKVKMIISGADVDVAALDAQIAATEKILDSAEGGSDYGQYSADVIAELKAAIAEAKEISKAKDSQIIVDRTVLELKTAITAFEGSANNKSANASGEYVINYDLEKAEFNVADNKAVVLKLDTDELTPAISSETFTPNGTIKMEIPRGTALSGSGWNGEIKTPAKTETPSANAGSGIIISGVYNVSDTAVEADRLVRFVFPGEGAKRVYYKDATGKYVEVRTRAEEDSEASAKAAIKEAYGAAKIKVGNDLVVYSNFITEFVTFSAGSAGDDSDDDYVSGGSQGGSYVPSAGGSSSSSGFHSSYTGTPGMSAANSFVFEDMKGHWAERDVMSMYNAGIVTGVTATTFEPDRFITRAEFATLIVKALGLTPEKTSDFADVNDEWFAPYVGAAAKAGIIVGSDGAFRPNDTITRQEMAVIVIKAYEYLGKSAEKAELTFADKSDIASWATDFVAKAVGAGLISGMGDNMFAPSANATRAQAASVISRIIK